MKPYVVRSRDGDAVAQNLRQSLVACRIGFRGSALLTASFVNSRFVNTIGLPTPTEGEFRDQVHPRYLSQHVLVIDSRNSQNWGFESIFLLRWNMLKPWRSERILHADAILLIWLRDPRLWRSKSGSSTWSSIYITSVSTYKTSQSLRFSWLGPGSSGFLATSHHVSAGPQADIARKSHLVNTEFAQFEVFPIFTSMILSYSGQTPEGPMGGLHYMTTRDLASSPTIYAIIYSFILPLHLHSQSHLYPSAPPSCSSHHFLPLNLSLKNYLLPEHSKYADQQPYLLSNARVAGAQN